MTTSISGSAVPTPPALIPLNLCGTGGRRIEKDVAKSAAEQHRAKIRRIRHDTELEAAEYAQILQKKLIARALDPNVDLKLLADITFKLQDRGVGRVREAESDDPEKQKGPEGALHDFLTAISAASKASLGHTQQQAIERDEKDITPPSSGIDLDGFFEADDGDG